MEIWVEKYRPRVLSEIVGNRSAMERLRGLVASGSMPNLILAGPPGIGKTTSCLALARELLGEEFARSAVLEMNASDDRGLEVVRQKIKTFAQQKVSLPLGKHKLVILDEADSMTESAQQALRRIMEVYAGSTRFALACNQSTKLIEPIQSRCAIVRFGRLADAEVLAQLQNIVASESLTATADGLEALVFTAEGDLRAAINNLQSTAVGFGTVGASEVFKVCDQPQPGIVNVVIQHCVDGKYNEAYGLLESLLLKGYAVGDIIGVLMRLVKISDAMKEDVKIEMLRVVTLFHLRASEGVASAVQLAGLVAQLCLVPRPSSSLRECPFSVYLTIESTVLILPTRV